MNSIGFAVDLGTTMVDTALVDTKSGHIIDKKSFKNRQSLYGSDVINRIMSINRDASLSVVMKNMIIQDLYEAMNELISKNKLAGVDMIGICGNTTMVSILMGYPVAGLGVYPFSVYNKNCIDTTLRELSEGEYELDCPVFISGCSSAFIGGDILSGLLYLNNEYGFSKEEGNSLFMDLGTNGEMLLKAGGKIYGTSTACGPAFEGCTRRQQIYGMATIDAISLCVSSGKINRDGVICNEYINKGIDVTNIHLDMDILHQVILAKAAIYSGIVLLAEAAGIQTKDIERVFISGGFGFSLNINNAINIGLLPAVFRDKIKITGNTSLKGAICMLSDSKNIEVMRSFSGSDFISVLQLGGNESYQNLLINNMNFKIG